MKMLATLMCSVMLVVPTAARSSGIPVFDAASFANFLQMISEAQRQYQMLSQTYNNARNAANFVRNLNRGINNATGILSTLPIQDEGLLADLNSFSRSYRKITELYGAIPESPDKVLQKLHDDTVAESIKMTNRSKEYAQKQEENASMIKSQSHSASPKGAARMTAESNALILHGINQLIRLQGQSLKLQSEQLALTNRRDKNEARNFKTMNRDFERAFQRARIGGDLPRF